MFIIPKKLYTPIYFFFVITLLNGREEFFNDKIMIYICLLYTSDAADE